MAEVITNLGLTVQNKDTQRGDTFIKADVSIKVDDTKPVEEQLEWAKMVARKAWETASELLGEKITEEEIVSSKEKRELVLRALRDHASRLKALEAKVNMVVSK